MGPINRGHKSLATTTRVLSSGVCCATLLLLRTNADALTRRIAPRRPCLVFTAQGGLADVTDRSRPNATATKTHKFSGPRELVGAGGYANATSPTPGRALTNTRATRHSVCRRFSQFTADGTHESANLASTCRPHY